VSKALDFIKHEAREAVFPTIFFFCVFHFAIATKTLILDAYSVTPGAVASAVVGALIVAKAILVIDATPLARPFPGKPLLFRILWDTVLYGALIFIFKALEELIPAWIKADSFGSALDSILSEVSWPEFWAIQLWLAISVFAYASIVRIDEYFGEGSLRHALFSAAPDNPPRAQAQADERC